MKNPYQKPGITGIEELFYTYPQLQNEFSSMWFFFVLFPKQGNAFGPKQLMFSFASKVGIEYGVGGKWQRGMKLIKNDPKERDFMTTAVGWCFDGETMHENLVHQDVLATASKDGWVKAWIEQDNGEKYGGEIILVDRENPQLDVHFNGADGFGKFHVYAEDDWEMSQPLNYDSFNKFFNSLLIAWRKFSFKGDFGYGGKTEELEGYGYFQRVCVNLPTMPWFWPILMFPDGSVFSSFQPYYGSNCFVKNNKVTNSILKRLRLNVASSAYYADNSQNKVIYFDESLVNEIPSSNPEVEFEIISKNNSTGDYVRIHAISLAETGWDLEKRLYGYLHSLWNYNEHIVKIVDIEGKINGKVLSKDEKVYGNIEYVWGMSV